MSCFLRAEVAEPVPETAKREQAAQSIVIFQPIAPLQVGEWREIPVSFTESALEISELKFFVFPGPHGGEVSKFAIANGEISQSIHLLAGWKPGPYEIRVFLGTSLVGSEHFEVQNNNSADTSMWVAGDNTTNLTRRFPLSPEMWSGVDVSEQVGLKRILVLPLEFDDQQFQPTDDPIGLLQANLIDGVPHPKPGSPDVSVQSFWTEVSGGRLELEFNIYPKLSFGGNRPPGTWEQAVAPQALARAQSELGIDVTEFDGLFILGPGVRFADPPICVPDELQEISCDGKDNDCDGLIDEQDTSLGLGGCNQTPTCGDGVVSVWMDDGEVKSEECDDGGVDEANRFADRCWKCLDFDVAAQWPNVRTVTYTVSGASGGAVTRTMKGTMYSFLFRDYMIQEGLNSTSFVNSAAHEVGHIFGLADLYKWTRPLGSFDVMSNHEPLSGLNLPTRAEMGWVDRESVYRFHSDWIGGVVPITEVIEIAPLASLEDGSSLNAPFVGVEMPLGDGHGLYWDFRYDDEGNGMTDHSSMFADDPTDPQSGVVFGVDRIRGGIGTGTLRRNTIRVADSHTTQDWALEMEDANGIPGLPWELMSSRGSLILSARLLDASSDAAVIESEYRLHQPENIAGPNVSIHTWPNGDRRWQSPDIFVVNVRNDGKAQNGDPLTGDDLKAEEALENLPWANRTNRVVARVTNNGSVDALDVVVHFRVALANLGIDPPTEYLGSQSQDVPANSTVEFEVNWVPKTGETHSCIKVEIQQHSLDDFVDDNLAQSNYTQFMSDSASPARLGDMQLTVQNGFNTRMRAVLVPNVDSGIFVLLIDQRSLVLEAGEVGHFGVQYQYRGDFSAEWGETVFSVPIGQANFEIEWVPLPDIQQRADALLGGDGVTAQLLTGFRTLTTIEQVTSNTVSGIVNRASDGEPVPRGRVVCSFWIDWPAGQVPPVDIDGIFMDGEFECPTPSQQFYHIKAEYLGVDEFVGSSDAHGESWVEL